LASVSRDRVHAVGFGLEIVRNTWKNDGLRGEARESIANESQPKKAGERGGERRPSFEMSRTAEKHLAHMQTGTL